MGSEPITVMLVDDHPVVRAGFRRLLESDERLEVVAEAETGEESLSLYKAFEPGVVVMDISLPGIGGLEAVRRILLYDPEARLLVFSIHDNEAMVSRALRAGVLGYMTKDAAPTQLLDAVCRVAEGKTYIDANLVGRVLKDGGSGLLDRLTPREFEVFCLLVEGNSVARVADILSISPKTAGVHQTRIMNKLEVHTPVQLVRLAIQQGVLKT